MLLELALVRFAIELVRAEGHEPVVPPVLVREEALEGTGFLPGDRDQIYEIPKDELFLAGTSEVALAGLHADEILDRRGAAAALLRLLDLLPPRGRRRRPRYPRHLPRPPVRQGRDVLVRRALARRRAEHERLLAIEERILTELELPYRVVNVAVGDLGAPAAKKYDCEAWIPSQGRYRELTSCSNTTDYQARRLGCRYRPERGRSAAGGAHPERHRGGGRAHDDRADREPAGTRRRIHATQYFASVRLSCENRAAMSAEDLR